MTDKTNELQGYEYFTDKQGKVMTIERATGEVLETINIPVGSLAYTPEQRREYAKRKSQKQIAYLQSKRYGAKKPQYTFVSTAEDFENVSPANLSRLIFLATHLSYHNNELRTSERHKLTKKELASVLDVSESTAERFWREVSPKYIVEGDDGVLRTNPEIFAKGRIKHLMTFYIKVYAKGMEHLYFSVHKSKHKHLGYVFAMLPYINIEHNILCWNTEETDISKVKPMSMREFCDEIGFNYKHIDRLHRAYKKMSFDVGEGKRELFCSIIKNEYTGKELMIINPKVFYSGRNSDAVLEFGKFFLKE